MTKVRVVIKEHNLLTHGGERKMNSYAVYLGNTLLRYFSANGDMKNGYFGSKKEETVFEYVNAIAKELDQDKISVKTEY